MAASKGNGYDRRYSSIAGDIDAAIESVVTHFEDNDVALRLDVLRSLTVHAKLAFETERIKQRLAQHPVSKELIECVTTQNKIYERLHKALVVEEFNCDYDRVRNVEMQAIVRWELPAETTSNKKSKRRSRTASDKPLWARYKFSRRVDEESGETVVAYTVSVSLGVDSEMKELVRFEMASDSPYPRSFYEDDQEMEDDDEEESGEEEEVEEEDEEKEDAMEDGEKEHEDEDEDEEKDPFGEQLRGFDFNDEMLDAILDWLNAEDEELDPADVIGFFLALPIYEDDWMIDERVCQILFNSGGGSEMEEEIVSDFDDDEQQEGEDGGDDDDQD